MILYVYYRPPGLGSANDLSLLKNSLTSNPETSCIVLILIFLRSPDRRMIQFLLHQVVVQTVVRKVPGELIGDNFMQQFIVGPTHLAGNKLDLLFCNRDETISNVLTSSPVEHNFPTDQYIIEFTISTKFTRAKPVRRVIYDYNHADISALRRALSKSSLDITLTDSIDECWTQWKEKFLIVHRVQFCPHKNYTEHQPPPPPWIDGEVRHLIRKKYTALRKYHNNKTADRKLNLPTLCQQIK